ncbi:SCO family protein [bacterium]|nr:SCO family protein [bacterium]
MTATPAKAEEPLPNQLEGVAIQEHLGEQLDLSIPFTDHNGQAVTLKNYVRGDLPVILTLNYYECPMLCTLVLNSLTKSLGGMDWAPGQNFRIVTISIDPNETPKLAAKKRASHLEELGLGDADWSFLVGTKENIDRVAETVGFGYKYDEDQDQYAHPAAIFFLSPEGKVSRYLYGLDYKPRDVKFALVESSEGRVGSPVDKLVLSCFHYDSSIGAYGPFAFGMMRVGGVVTVVVMAVMLGFFWRRENAESGGLH